MAKNKSMILSSPSTMILFFKIQNCVYLQEYFYLFVGLRDSVKMD